jgi:uncharacterized protein with GYD domain
VPKYLWQVSYTVEGTKGVLKDGAAKRRTVTKEMVEGLGGKLEMFDYALGDTDAFVVAQLPDNATAAAVSMVVSTGGGATIKTTVLLSPEEVDKAATKHIAYTPPGK